MSPKRPPRAEAPPPKPFASRDSPEPPRTAGASTSSPDKEPSVCPPGRAIFAVVVPPKELEPEDKRALIASSLQNMPPRYRVVECACGAVAFLGEGVPSPGAGPAFAPQVLENERCVLALVSRDIRAAVVADAFRDACDAHLDEPKTRALALKRHLCGLSEKGNAFSFVLLDLATARVFAATTALSSPLAAGHAADGTLLVTCTRSGAKAATAWPPRWAQGASSASSRVSRHAPAQDSDRESWKASLGSPPSDARRTDNSSLVGKEVKKKSRGNSAFGASPPTHTARPLVSSELLSKHARDAPLTPERLARPTSPASTERSRSRSPGASSTHSTNTEASEVMYQAAVTTKLQHLPAGRFVYGRKHLQPFEFSAFWGSAESTRAGARAASVPEAPFGKDACNAARAEIEAKGGEESFGEGRNEKKEETNSARFAVGRPRFSDTGSRGDTASSWRKKALPAAPALAGGAAPERDPAAPRWDGWGRGDGSVPAWGTSRSGARPGSSPGTGMAAPTPASFRAVLERSHSMEDSGSPTRGGLTRAFASSGLT